MPAGTRTRNKRSAAGRAGGQARARNMTNQSSSGTRSATGTATKARGRPKTASTSITKRSTSRRSKSTMFEQMPQHLLQEVISWSLEEAARQQQALSGTSGTST